VAKPAERLLVPGFRLVDQCLLLLGRLYQGGPLLGIGRLLVALADTPSQVCAVFRSRAMSSCTSRSSSAIACGSRPGSRGRAKEVPHLFVGGLGEVPVGLPDREERRRRGRADHLVGQRIELPAGGLGRGRPFAFFAWITALADVIAAAAPFTQPAPLASKVFTAIINIVVGVAVISLLSGVGRSAARPVDVPSPGGPMTTRRDASI